MLTRSATIPDYYNYYFYYIPLNYFYYIPLNYFYYIPLNYYHVDLASNVTSQLLNNILVIILLQVFRTFLL